MPVRRQCQSGDASDGGDATATVSGTVVGFGGLYVWFLRGDPESEAARQPD